jgi:hypothetical protein
MVQSIRFLGVIALSVVLFSCSQTKTMTGRRDISKDTVMLQRTVCYGRCPAYDLIIYGTGKVEFDGGAFSKTEGKVSVEIPVDSVRVLLNEIEESEFFSWNNEYLRQDATDLSSAIVTITIDGKSKKIKHYKGDSTAPEKLLTIERRIDEITNSEQWTR